MRVSKRDWTLLSTYLDGELSPREAQRVENRLERQPGLQAALEDLRELKHILAETPHLPVPRNFTLTPGLVGLERGKVGLKGLQLAAAALSFLFIATLIVDVGTTVLKVAGPVSMAPLAEEVRQEAPIEEQADEFAAPQAEAELNAEETDQTLESQDQEAAAAEVQEESQAAAEPEQMTAGTASVEEPVLESGAEPAESTSTAPPAPAAERKEVGQAEGEPQEGGQFGNQPQPPSETAQEETATNQIEQGEFPPVSKTWNWVRILEILFGIGAVGFGAAAWSKRRR